ncbi:MAG: primosomal protein N' [Schleiferiaceae bacterium]|nr:primosomal protein N' [Schleiferiaceae bacterium]
MYKFARVILPLALPKTFTYWIPPALESGITVGSRVLVQFGTKRQYSAIVAAVLDEQPQYEAKPILEVLDDFPLVSIEQLKFWKWLAEYYMCSIGEILIAALPAGFKLESDTKVMRAEEDDIPWDDLTDEEFLIMEALQATEELTLKEIVNIIDVASPIRILQRLVQRGLIVLKEEIKKKQRPRTVKSLRLHPSISEGQLETIFSDLAKAEKQSRALLAFLTQKTRLKSNWVPYEAVTAVKDVEGHFIRALVDRKILDLQELDPFSMRLVANPEETIPPAQLNLEQEQGLAALQSHYENHKVCLLHGVTGSGKTEIYVHLIQEALQRGERVLYLLPEIALTAQLVQRLKAYFGADIVVYHSRVREKDRMRLWQNLATNHQDTPKIILGARSALLLPHPNLGLIIIDEEHETSFKQFEPSPRYHARDAALWLAHQSGAKVLLGSATPSLESWHLAQEGKYGFVALHGRFGGVAMPEIEVINIKYGFGNETGSGHFSPALTTAIQSALEREQRVILFQNRRGFSPTVQCQDCGTTMMCQNCDISLTYHKFKHQMKCHYCGFTIAPQNRCNACGSTRLKLGGFGTEKLEEDLSLLFPDAKIARMDWDSTRKVNAVEKIIADFESGAIDILVGTQMVTKGLDFDKVALVGIVAADSLLYFPEFRAHERAFQLMAQVAGRAGRRGERGKVLIQTYSPNHAVIGNVVKNDFHNMAAEELAERKKFYYPPFCRLIQITLTHKKLPILEQGAAIFGERLRAEMPNHVLGPIAPSPSRLKGLYQMQLLIKVDKTWSPVKVKKRIKLHADAIFLNKPYTSTRIIYDVDPA